MKLPRYLSASFYFFLKFILSLFFILGRTDYVIALALAKDIISNWRPVPRPKPDSRDEVDASRVKRMLVCAEYKGTIHILRKHNLGLF